jgi:hypothetical protein
MEVVNMAAQADSKSTSSRRTLLARAALAVVPIAAVAAQASVKSDTELLALGTQFDELVRRMAMAERLDEPYQEAMRAMLEKMHRERTGPISDEEYVKAYDRVAAEFPRPSPCPDDISDAMDPIMRHAHALPALSIAGLKVKARAARFACRHFWEHADNEADWDHKCARAAIDAVLSLPEMLA